MIMLIKERLSGLSIIVLALISDWSLAAEIHVYISMYMWLFVCPLLVAEEYTQYIYIYMHVSHSP